MLLSLSPSVFSHVTDDLSKGTLRPFLLWQVAWPIIPGCSCPTEGSKTATVAPEKVPEGESINQAITDRAGSVRGLGDKMLFLILPLANPETGQLVGWHFSCQSSIAFNILLFEVQIRVFLGICKVPCRTKSKYNLISPTPSPTCYRELIIISKCRWAQGNNKV